MWSNDRFSIINTTMCLRLSSPAGIGMLLRIDPPTDRSLNSAVNPKNVSQDIDIKKPAERILDTRRKAESIAESSRALLSMC
jgi:hypothetical protein